MTLIIFSLVRLTKKQKLMKKYRDLIFWKYLSVAQRECTRQEKYLFKTE
jgi:hypothetical protein